MDDHFRRVELPISIDEFYRLPRNAAYKYEYFDGRAVLTPRPKSFNCVLDLRPFDMGADARVTVSHLSAADARTLADLFVGAVRGTQPFASLGNDEAKAAALDYYDRALTGGDGPLVEAACVRADDNRDRGPVGGALVTLAPPEVLTDPFAGVWREPPPADAVERRLGVPHLTWVFVHPWMARRGAGTSLLAGVVGRLTGMGFTHLASTFLLDNGPSALWHWRNGFRLLPQMSEMLAQVRRESP